ncbi:MAG: hypothetical protein XD51_1309, partial [Moorella sp. 60_41]
MSFYGKIRPRNIAKTVPLASSYRIAQPNCYGGGRQRGSRNLRSYPENKFPPGRHCFRPLSGPRGAGYGSTSGSGGVPGLFSILSSEAGLGLPVLGPALPPRLRRGCSSPRIKSLARNKCRHELSPLFAGQACLGLEASEQAFAASPGFKLGERLEAWPEAMYPCGR